MRGFTLAPFPLPRKASRARSSGGLSSRARPSTQTRRSIVRDAGSMISWARHEIPPRTADRTRTQRPPRAPPTDALRALPSVTEMLEHPALAAALAAPGRRGVVTECIRAEIDAVRAGLRRKSGARPDASAAAVAAAGPRAARARRPPHAPRAQRDRRDPALRARPRATLAAAPPPPRRRAAAATRCSRSTARRASAARATRAAWRSCAQLTGAEDGLFVNNNAAATVLILNTLARGRQVICSRGEMVEIGGSFRIPDVMEASGCELVSVGHDEQDAPRRLRGGDRTEDAARSSSSTRATTRSSASPSGRRSRRSARSAARAASRSSTISDRARSSSPRSSASATSRPCRASVRAGADLVCMSGDKLLGGPQAGIILGRQELVERCRNNPLARAFRIDKLRVAAMEATLELFLDPRALSAASTRSTAMLRATPDVAAAARRGAARGDRRTGPRGPRGRGRPVASPRPAAARFPRSRSRRSRSPSTHPAVPAGRAGPGALRLEPTPLFSVVRAGRVLLDVRTLEDGDVAARRRCRRERAPAAPRREGPVDEWPARPG